MSSRVPTQEFFRWLKTTLESTTGKPIGIGDVPSLNPELPYAIIWPIPSPRPTGDWQDPERDQEITLQMMSVGRGDQDTNWMADRLGEIFLGRNASGKYEYDLDPGDICSILWRLSDGIGGIVKSGDYLFQRSDTYRLKVSRT